MARLTPSSPHTRAAHNPTRPPRRSSAWTLAALALALALVSLTAAAATPPPPPPSPPPESYHEHLLLRPLPDGRLHAAFDFTLLSHSHPHNHFHLLPRPLLHLLDAHSVDQVHLSLNSGRWDYASWGSPRTTLPRPHAPPAHAGDLDVAPGAQLWATLRHPHNTTALHGDQQEEDWIATHPFDPPDAVAHDWAGLTSSLAGLFCTSLNSLHSQPPAIPILAPLGPRRSSSTTSSTTTTLHAFLPSESICTENLTPLLKLLPCKGHAGLASLLNPLALFAANFQGMAVHAQRRHSSNADGDANGDDDADADAGWEIRLSVQAVFAPAVTRDISSRDWSLSSLFGRTVQQTCPLASSSLITVTPPDDQGFVSDFVLQPLPPRVKGPAMWARAAAVGGQDDGDDDVEMEEVEDDNGDAQDQEGQATASSAQQRRATALQRYWTTLGAFTYDLSHPDALSALSSLSSSSPSSSSGSRSLGLDISMTWPSEHRFRYPTSIVPPSLTVSRTVTGSGLERVTLHATLRNNHANLRREVVYYESLPFFLMPLLHTLRGSVAADAYDEKTDEHVRFEDEVRDDPVRFVAYQPLAGAGGGGGGGGGGTVVEIHLSIPPRSEVRLELVAKRAWLRYAQHPPDAHRGFDLPPSIAFILPPHSSSSSLSSPFSSYHPHHNRKPTPRHHHHHSHRNEGVEEGEGEVEKIYTTPRLIELATPDFSFVYTGIIFTSTVIALFFGSTLNGLVRRFRDVVV